MRLIPSGQKNMNDELFYLLNVTIGGFPWPWIGDNGKVVSKLDDAGQFVLILPLADCGDDDDDGQEPGYLATVVDGDVDTYYGSLKGTLDNSFNFPYSWEEIQSGEASLNGKFSIRYDEDSPLFPYCQTLYFKNEIFTTCDNAAIFCAPLDHTGNFREDSDVEAQRSPKYPSSCKKLHLAVECVTPNCFIEEEGDQCSATCTNAAAR